MNEPPSDSDVPKAEHANTGDAGANSEAGITGESGDRPRPRPQPFRREPSPGPRTETPEPGEVSGTGADEHGGSGHAEAHTDEHEDESAEGGEADASDESDTAGVGDSRRPRVLAAVFVVSLLLAVVLAAGGAVLWYVRDEADHEQRNSAITVSAREVVKTMLTMDPDNVDGSVDKVLASATGGWRQEFAEFSEQFGKVVQEQQVRAEVTITGSAIQRADDDSARVLVSANSVIKNQETPDGYAGAYRVLLNLESQGDEWLVSDLQFVA